jgi:hypothetical protein
MIVGGGKKIEGAVVVLLGEFARGRQERIVMQRSG